MLIPPTCAALALTLPIGCALVPPAAGQAFGLHVRDGWVTNILDFRLNESRKSL